MKKIFAFILAITLFSLSLTSCEVNYTKNEWFSEDKLNECLIPGLPKTPEGKSFVISNDSELYISLTNVQYEEYVKTIYTYMKEQGFKYLGTRGMQKHSLAGAFATYFFEEATYLSQFAVNGGYKFVYSDGTLDENGEVLFSILTVDFCGKNTMNYGGEEFYYNTVISLCHGSEGAFTGFYVLPAEGDHQHIFGEWEYDENFHWCTWDCTWDMCDIDTTAEHFDGDEDGICDACGYPMA